MANDLLSVDYIVNELKEILPFEADTDIYDIQLDRIVKGAISKLHSEGLPIDITKSDGSYWFTEDSYEGNDYLMCIAYQTMKDMDYDVDTNYLTEQYITRVNTLRMRTDIGRHR